MNDHDATNHDDLMGQPLPPLTLEAWQNGITSLDDLAGRIIVIDFWATWCQPCLGAIPKNNRLAEEYANRGVTVLGICATTGSEKMEEIATERGIQYPIAKDMGKASEKALGVRWFPCYFLINRDGTVYAARITDDDVEEALRRLPEWETAQ